MTDLVERLRAAIRKACSEMGCYCKSDPPDGSCPMHQLEKALGSADAGSQGEHICGTPGAMCDTSCVESNCETLP
jgi:hypothetical protein